MIPVEQLSLPDFNAPSGGPVAIAMIFKDVQTDNPKVLLSMRLHSGMFGYPGGKLRRNEFGKPVRGARRETLAETGIRIPGDYYLREFSGSPRRIVAEGKEQHMHMFYGFLEEFAWGMRPERREPDKHSPWRFFPIRILPRLVTNGMLLPATVQVDNMGVIDMAYPSFRRKKEFRDWMNRDCEIDLEMQTGRYGFLEYIHDKENGHLVF